ncbi:MAG: 30S ribosomal protein S15 [Candidatus Aenigmarchaeota archaeon]|nr:30S ribosomal protein S15 [Candidatus Aenigmarchaeota archaeon]MDI6722639.1 30S ribosomal protein S15 [Candidatus Aenigmarchaeota archaeon]
MARMHSRKHGKHGSHKPPKKKHTWLAYEKEEVEKLIIKLAKEGNTSVKIGTILRDQYGIPDVRVFGMKVSEIAGREKKEIPDDMYSLMIKVVNLHKHMASNKGDAKAKHGLELLESKIRRLGKYYSRTGKLQKGWKYSIDEAKLLVK